MASLVQLRNEGSRLNRSHARCRTSQSRKSSHADNPLLCAAQDGDEDKVAACLADHDHDSLADQYSLNTAFIKAAALGHSSICQTFLDAGANMEAFENWEEHAERTMDVQPGLTHESVQRQSWIQQHTSAGGTALHRAVENGHTETVKILIKNGCSINVVDKNGVTALMLATMRRGTSAIVKHLLDSDTCDVDMVDRLKGRTALHYAAEVGDADNVKLLLEHGAEPDVYDYNSNTALLLVVTPIPYEDKTWPPPNLTECAEFLLKTGCFVNVFNKNGDNALSVAVEIGEEGVVKCLLDNCAIINQEVMRVSVLTSKDPKILKLLISAGPVDNDECMICLLLILLSNKTSKWMSANEVDELATHNLSQILINNIADFRIVEHMWKKPTSELEKYFGKYYTTLYKEEIHPQLMQLGLLGFALKNGAFGVAEMLYRAGCDLTNHTQIEELFMVQYMNNDKKFQSWFTEALFKPRSLKSSCRNALRQSHFYAGSKQEKLVGKDIVGYLALSDIDQVRPYDVNVREKREQLLDEWYSTREAARAVAQQMSWIYT